jgi:hypothetical protein
MKHVPGGASVRTRLCAAAVATALAFVGLAGGSASADSGDAFYLSWKKPTFIAFAVRAGSNEASDLVYNARAIPCRGKGHPGPTGMGSLPPGRTVPIVDGAFKDDWSHLDPKFGGIRGTVGDDSATGTLRLRISLKAQGKPLKTCSTGPTAWTAKSVSEEKWLAARDEYYDGHGNG